MWYNVLTRNEAFITVLFIPIRNARLLPQTSNLAEVDLEESCPQGTSRSDYHLFSRSRGPRVDLLIVVHRV